MELPATIAAEAALTRQNVALGSLKASADQAKAIANILEESLQAVPQGSRGSNANISA